MTIVRAVTSVFLLACLAGTAATAQIGFSRSVFLADYPSPRRGMIGDVDGDGRCEFVGYYPGDAGIIDIVRMSRLGKPMPAIQAHTSAGAGAVIADCGRFAPKENAAVLLIMPDGALRLVHGARPGELTYQASDSVGRMPQSEMPRAPLLMAVADFDNDGRVDAVVAGSDGRAVWLRNNSSETKLDFEARGIGRIGSVVRLSAGALDGTGPAGLVGMRPDGTVLSWAIESNGGARWALCRAATLGRSARGDGLCVGRFGKGTPAQALAGRQILPSGGPMNELPPATEARTDYAWLAGDFDGDGRDDVVRCQRSSDPLNGNQVRLHFSINGTEIERAAFGDYDNDGLLNGWETGQIHPGGLDLKALGCSPVRQDVICEVQRFEDFPEERLRAEMDRVVAYYASLPSKNPDGSRGIALHVIVREPIPVAQLSRPWFVNGDEHHPREHRGITHWMQVARGGGGQAGELADRGGCGGDALYATFIHEFGHQLGLDHTGRWRSGQCPVYPSLMNYAYSYQLGGDPNAIGYSTGRLRHIVLNERDLDEYLPARPEDLISVSGPPYHFKIKPAPDGKGALVDWNWNGVFGERHVRADIDYGYSTHAGDWNTLGKTYTAPALATLGTGLRDRLVLFGASLNEGEALPLAEASEPAPSLCAARPGRLYMREWTGADRSTNGLSWSPEAVIESRGVTGDPSAASVGRGIILAYPTELGAAVRFIGRSRTGQAQAETATILSGTVGAEPTVARVGRRILLTLWRGKETPLAFRWLELRKSGVVQIGSERSLGFASVVPVGVAEGIARDALPTVWFGLMQDIPQGHPSRYQVRRFAVERDGSLREIAMEWIGGEKGIERGSSRVALIHIPDKTMPGGGQLLYFACGLFGPTTPWSCHFVCMRLADRSVNGGWLTRRYFNEWAQSRSAPGVCRFRDDLAFAGRWFGNVHGTENDNLFVGFYASGISRDPMGDFDDIGLISDYGMARSIPLVYSDAP